MVTIRSHRTLIRGTALLVSLISLMWPALTVPSKSAQKTSKDRPALSQEKKQQERDQKRESFKSGRELLLKHGVGFDPDILLEPDWKDKLAPALSLMPEFREFREGEQKMEGVQLADTLLLPEQVELIGETVVIARQVIFSGKNVIIKGPHNFTFFPIEPIITLDSSLRTSTRRGSDQFVKAGPSTARLLANFRKRGLLTKPASITIDLDALGRDEWLEKKKTASRLDRSSDHPVRSEWTMLVAQELDKDPGAQGAEGGIGQAAVEPPQAGIGDNGNNAAAAGTGGVGQRGVDGDPGHIFTGFVPAGSTPYFISVRGGRGGQGGTGRPGGSPARGGKGGKGRPGDVCECPLTSGNGGRGGRGGKGSIGGTGGQGGPGATGGRGGTINLTVSCSYTGNLVVQYSGGGEGPQGMPGRNSDGGLPGFGGEPGTAARNISCPDKAGRAGGAGQSGLPGENTLSNGQPGAVGQHGPDGTYNPPITRPNPCPAN
jgi:hypothetical protein